jgi:hypothetical protein
VRRDDSQIGDQRLGETVTANFAAGSVGIRAERDRPADAPVDPPAEKIGNGVELT